MSSTLRSTLCTALIAVALGDVACATPTSVTSEWKNPSYAAGPLHNVLVIGGRLDYSQRRTLEDGFVSALEAHGVRAIPSHDAFPGGLPDATMVRATVEKEGFDGVLIAAMRGIRERTAVEPGAGWNGGELYGGYWGDWGPGSWGGGGAYYVEEDVKFETTVWTPSGSQMIWSAVTQTENPRSGKDFAQSLVKRVVPAMARDGLVPARTGPQVASVKAAR